MHAQGNAQPHRHIQDRALTTHPLSGTQQGGHVLESEGATSLQQFLHRLSFFGTFLNAIRVYVCVFVQRATHSGIKVLTTNAAFHGSLGPLMCPFMVHMLDLCGCFVFSSAKCLVWDEVISFPSHGRLGDHDMHCALQMPSICGVCFHL